MAGTRALFASIGVSVALVAAAALSLLAVSVMFAFGWTSVSVPESVRTQPLVLADTTPSSASTRARRGAVRPIVAAAPAPRPRPSAAARTSVVRARARVATSRVTRAARSTPVLTPPTTHSIGTSKSPPPAIKATINGEGVRKVGDELSATVKDTGKAVAEITKPLAPPVSTAVQTVVNVVADLLQNTTAGLAAVVDKLLPPKQ